METQLPYAHLSTTDSEHEASSKQETAARRSDLQGLRGWAVLAVVLFHFFPKQFSYGFLGVDVYFVLSGFLIASVLHNHFMLEDHTYGQFYFRRFRRMFPLVLLFVLLVLIYSSARFTGARLYYQKRSALYALSFTSNIKQADEGEHYFFLLEKAEDFLTHTWSLAVEVQFYVVVPLIMLIGKKVCGPVGHPFLVYLFLIAVASFCFHAFSDTFIAFNNVFSRLWQFVLGAFVFNLQIVEPHEHSEGRFIYKFLWMLTMLGVTFLFVCFESSIMYRLLVTVGACGLIHTKTSSPLLSHNLIVIIGDCSYSLYLLHWPAVCILNEFCISSEFAKILTVYFCITLAHLSYLYCEKWYLKLCEHETFLLVGSLYLANVIVYLTPNSNFHGSLFSTNDPTSTAYPLLNLHQEDRKGLLDWLSDPNGNWTLNDFSAIAKDEAYEINNRYNLMWNKNILIPNCKFVEGENPFGFCEAPRGNGNLTFLSIGNSYNPNHARLIIKHFRPYYSTLHFHSRGACLAISDGSNANLKHCKSAEDPIHLVVQRKPDILFVIQRFYSLNKPIQSDIYHDEQFVALYNVTEELAKHTKKIFIMDALPATRRAAIDFLNSGENILSEIEKTGADLIRKRLNEVARRCSNCVLFDTFNAHLTPNGSFMGVDPHSHIFIFERVWHHSPYGLRLIEPVFEELSSRFSLLLNSSTPFNTLNIAP